MKSQYRVGLKKVKNKLSYGVAALSLLFGTVSGSLPLLFAPTATALSSSSVVINEVSSHGTEWVELYNKTASAVDISGWHLQDAAANSFGSTIAAGTTVPAHGYYVVAGSGSVLNDTGDSITLFSASNDLLDTMNFPALSTGETYGRSGAGGTSVDVLPYASQGGPNFVFSYNAVLNQTQQFWYKNLADAVALANTNDTLVVHGTQTITSTIDIKKPMAIRGASGATIATSGTAFVFRLQATADGSTISGLNFTKTDTAAQMFITIQSNNTRIWNNTFTAQYQTSSDPTTRGLEISAVSNIDVRNNTFKNLRQPAYINEASGTVRNNYVAHTRGWVVVPNSSITFVANTWGTGVDRNAVDIAIIPGSPDNYLSNLMHISNINHNAVIEDQTPTNWVMTDAFVDDSAASGGNGYPIAPYQTITPALSRIVEGGRVHVANGSYAEGINVVKDGTQLIGESQAGVQVTQNAATSYGQGISVNGRSNVTISNMSFTSPSGAPVNYAFQAYQSSNVTLNNLTFSGGGTSAKNSRNQKYGGVDFNSVNKATLNNVSASNFSKNGFSFTAQYLASDPFTRNVTLNGITSDGNNWAGLAFYNMNSSATVGHTIPGVVFSGNNSLTNNTKGLEIVGDSDANAATLTTPRWSVSGPGNSILNLESTAFNNNSQSDIINYQKKDVTATSATFSGKTGNTMSAAERQSENNKIVDQKDSGNLGLVRYYNAPTVPTNGQPNATILNTNNFDFSWNASDGDAPLTYEFQSSQNSSVDGNGVLTTSLWHSGVLNSPTIHSSGAADGVWYWQVRAKDANGNYSAWSPVWTVTLDTTAPQAPRITAPTPRQWFKTTPITNSWTAATDNLGVAGYQVAYQYDDHHSFGGSTCPGETINGYAVYCRDASGLSRNHTPGTSEQGGVTIWVRAVDNAGNRSVWSDSVHYYYDYAAPSTDIHVSVSNGVMTVSGDATDNLSLNRVYVQLVNRENSQRYGGTTINLIGQGKTAHWTKVYDFHTLGYPDGHYAAHVTATDMAGNSGSAGWTQNYTVSTTPAVTANYFAAEDKQLNVGFNVNNAQDVTKVEVSLYDEHDNLVTKNIGDSAQILALITSNPSGEISSPFYIPAQGTTDGWWTFGNPDWTTVNAPTYAIVTLYYGSGSHVDSNPVNLVSSRGYTYATLVAGLSGHGGGTENEKETTQESHNPQLAGPSRTLAAAIPGQTLGASDTNNDTNKDNSKTTGKVKGAQTDNSSTKTLATDDSTKNIKNSNFLGLGWWWLAVLALVVGFFLFLYRRSDSNAAN